MHKYIASGPQLARVLIVGEAPGANEELHGKPFIGSSGDEFRSMLKDAGIDMDSCRITNVCHVRPPRNDIKRFFLNKTQAKALRVEELYGKYPNKDILEGLDLLKQEVERTNPDIILAAGNTALWALTGKDGILDWRGSQMHTLSQFGSRPCVPILHPAFIMREYSWRAVTINDLRMRADPERWREVDYDFTIRPDFDGVLAWLTAIPSGAKITCDIETRRGQIACIGIGASSTRALCIPIQCVENIDGYWTAEEEVQIILAVQHTLARCRVVGHNFQFDNQYFATHYGFYARVYMDTMLTQHIAWARLRKSLAYCASMYCEQYVFWKDDGREWDPAVPEEQFWSYNCMDCARTYEVSDVLETVIDKKGLREQFRFQHERLYDPVFRMMLRGVKANKTQLAQFALDVNEAQSRVHQYVLDISGEADFNPGSSQQLQQFVYNDCRVKPVYKQQTGQPTLDKNAIPIIAQREPILAPMLEAILHYRSLGVYAGNFLAPGKVGRDGRFHTFYKMTGPYTYRFASAEDAFGSGLNLQNIPRNRDEDDKKRKGGWRQMLEDIAYPPVRGLFQPDTGMVLLDSDLERADAQVVAWESDDVILKQIFREGLDIHTENARLIYNTGKPTDKERQLAKSACHAVNYVCKAKTLAKTLGITVHEADLFIRRWFEIHPPILAWHQRVEDQLMTTRTIRNIFGYEVMFFDRLDDLLADAVAWIGQSTVALVINHALCNVAENLPWVDLLLQVHDSLVMQTPISNIHRIEEIEAQLRIPVPYADELIIPVGTKGSNDNWAVCEKIEKLLARAAA